MLAPEPQEARGGAILWRRAQGMAEATWHRAASGAGSRRCPKLGGYCRDGGVVGVFSSPEEEILCGNKNIRLCACLRGALECGGIGAAGGAEGDICLPGSAEPRGQSESGAEAQRPWPPATPQANPRFGKELTPLCSQTGVFEGKCHHTCLVCCSLYIFITFSTQHKAMLDSGRDPPHQAKIRVIRKHISSNSWLTVLRANTGCGDLHRDEKAAALASGLPRPGEVLGGGILPWASSAVAFREILGWSQLVNC